MSNSMYSRRIPVFVTIIIALMLSVLPLPGWLEAFRPRRRATPGASLAQSHVRFAICPAACTHGFDAGS